MEAKQLKLTFLLTVLMSMVGAKAFANDIAVANGEGVTIYYTYTNNKTELAVSYRGSNYEYGSEYSGVVNIPESVTYNGTIYPVTSIGDYAFYRCSGLTSVTIPNSVTSIGGDAFYRCTGLTSIDIPNSVTSIGSSAFSFCSGLTKIIIPNSVTTIERITFTGCSSLSSVTIPNSVTSIEEYAFNNCYNLLSVTIPNSVTSIEEYAFNNCNLLSVTINSNTILSGYSSSLKDRFGEQVKEYQIGDGVEKIGSSVFSGLSKLTSVTIGNSVTSIGNQAFYGCTGLTSVTIPNSVKSIGTSAFYGCTGLTSVTIPNSVTSIGYQAFYNCNRLTSVTIPNSVTSIGSYTFYGCTGLTSVTIPNSVTSIGESAFSGCAGLTDIYCHIEEPLTINYYVFYGVPKNTCTLYVPIGSKNKYQAASVWKEFNIVGKIAQTITWAQSQVSIIDLGAAIELAAVASSGLPVTYTIKFGNDCGTIGERIFVDLVDPGATYAETALFGIKEGKIVIEAKQAGNEEYFSATAEKEFTVTTDRIAQTITWNNSQTTLLVNNEIELTAVASSGLPVTYTIKSGNDCGTLVTNGGKTFLKGTKKGKIVIEAKQAGNEEYCSVTAEKEFTVTDIFPVDTEFTVEKIVYRITSETEVKVVGHNEISGDVIIPDKVYYPSSEQRYSVKDIEGSAFYDCTGMTSLTIPSSVKQIGRQAFRGCTGITNLVINNGVETIGYAAFELCTGLTSVTIPNSVTYIDAWAFTACYGLKTVLIPNSVTTINHHAFNRCNALEDIYCYIEYPLTVTDNTFSGVPKGQSGCKLHVPIGSGDAYRNADVWKEFYIVEDLPTGIISIDNSQLTNDNDVWYTLNGTRLNGKPTKAGVYIVNGKKVVIK